MMKSGLVVLALLTALSACSVIKPKAVPLSPFTRPISNMLLSVTIPSRGSEAVLVLIAVNQGVETWATGDNVTLSLRDGVIVATRGLGFDVMGSDVQPTLDALAGRTAGPYTVTRRYLTADNKSLTVAATCTLAGPAADGRRVEQCKTADQSYSSSYWLDGAGRIARSEQWIGPEIGMLSTSYSKAG